VAMGKLALSDLVFDGILKRPKLFIFPLLKPDA